MLYVSMCIYFSLLISIHIHTYLHIYNTYELRMCVCILYICISSLSFIYRQPPRHPCFVMNLALFGNLGVPVCWGLGLPPLFRAIFSQKPRAATWIDYPKAIQNVTIFARNHPLLCLHSLLTGCQTWSIRAIKNWWLFQDIHPLAVSRNLGVFVVDPIKTQHLGMFTTHWWFLADLPHSTLQKDPELGQPGTPWSTGPLGRPKLCRDRRCGKCLAGWR